MGKSSEISGFYKLSMEERAKRIKEFADLTDEEVKMISGTGVLDPDLVNRMIENTTGTMPVPMGYAMNFMINGKDYIIPMAIEEPSVVAAASNSAKLCRAKGGFTASMTEPIMIGQIQLVNVKTPHAARAKILGNKEEILKLANDCDPVLVKFGGGTTGATGAGVEGVSGCTGCCAWSCSLAMAARMRSALPRRECSPQPERTPINSSPP